ncbi:hypothetical protein A1O1_06143 [Capronia coronata CBS 617.96]|uniref:Uncharacterized protein n=1 Tax=Capronia coronata CBS 617.96 TaxID=1182541 RepID=W9Y812_9EURO|nr:uncharacterized protein A1O1_06143 [Capronia coronata CBS 617.96]EXJ85775.1 hypothetical protein A1O1_06143 [Capronia coronata CBS 617.96]
MATGQSVAVKHWARIIKRWPVDRVRPEHISFQTVMQGRLQKASSPSAAAENVKANEALVSPANPPQLDEAREMRQVNALYSLLEDRYFNAYPIPAKLRNPESMPTHYDDVIKEMDEAPSRTWTQSLMKRIKGSLRFS